MIFDIKSFVFNPVIGLIHLSEKYLIETLRNECKKYVQNWLNDLELINFDEKKEFIPRHILYKDGTRKHIASEIGTNRIRLAIPNFIFLRLGTLCALYREYSFRDENLSSSILNILKHASTDDLEHNEMFIQMTDREKTNVYKVISEYLEQQTLSTGVIHHKQSASLMFASGDA